MNNERGRACGGRIFPAPGPKTTCRVGAISTPNLSAGNVRRRLQSTRIWRPPPAPRVHRWPTAGLPGRAAGRGARGRRGRVWRSARGAAPGGTPTVAADLAPHTQPAVTRRYTYRERLPAPARAGYPPAVTRRYSQGRTPRAPVPTTPRRGCNAALHPQGPQPDRDTWCRPSPCSACVGRTVVPQHGCNLRSRRCCWRT